MAGPQRCGSKESRVLWPPTLLYAQGESLFSVITAAHSMLGMK